MSLTEKQLGIYLTAENHQASKAKCQKKGWKMADVVRTLINLFTEGKIKIEMTANADYKKTL